MKSLGCLGLAAGCLLAIAGLADAGGWPWEKEKPKATTAWGWQSACDCVHGEKCTCGDSCTCTLGVGCKGKAGASAMDASDMMYMVGSQCSTNSLGQKQCFINGVPVPCDQPSQVAYLPAATPTSWGFLASAPVDPDTCPCCGMKMTAEQKTAMKARTAPPVVSYAAPQAYASSYVPMLAGNCAEGNCGTANASAGGRSFRTPIRTLFFRGRGSRGCGG